MSNKTTTYTATISTLKYGDRYIDDFVDYVYKVTSEKEAVDNIKILLKSHKEVCIKRLTIWQLIKLILKN